MVRWDQRRGVKHDGGDVRDDRQRRGAAGADERDLPPNMNFFMNVPVEAGGAMAIAEGISKPGDYVDLRAEKDVIVVISNCPQELNPCSGGNPTPIRLTVWQPR
jgi:uncharacterized protein